jgi:hypothetical protein
MVLNLGIYRDLRIIFLWIAVEGVKREEARSEE